MKILKIPLIFFIISIISIGLALAEEGLSEKVATFQNYYKKNYLEQVYVHLDKRNYLTGEVVRFKVYCLEKTTSKVSQLSKVSYLEILDQNNTPVLQTKVELKAGIGYGELFIPTNINSGNYVLRGYTRWMRNIGPDSFFHTMITIINPFKKLGLGLQADPSDITINFYPESGTLINDVKSKVVFECKNRDGYPINFTGKLYANDTILIHEFSPIKNGLGSFIFTPDISNKYHIVLYQPNSVVTTHNFLPIVSKGFDVNLSESNSDILLNIFCSDNSIANPSEKLYYIAHQKGRIIDKNYFNLNGGRSTIKIDKSLSSGGIVEFSFFNSDDELLRQRQFFKTKRKKDQLIQLSKKIFSAREKVAIDLSEFTNNLNSEYMNLSISVGSHHQKFEGHQISLNDYLLLSNSLKGFVFGLETFFEGPTDEVSASINNLLIVYNKQNILWSKTDSVDLAYIPEYRVPLVTGKVTNRWSKEPAPGIYTFLSIPGKHVQFNATRSHMDGSIVFEMQNLYGSNEVVVQTDYSQDTIYSISIDNPFSMEFIDIKLPALNIDETMENWIKHQSQNMQIKNAYQLYSPKSAILDEIDTSTFYNEPDSRYFLDDFTRFIVMEEVMREYVYGVNVRKNKQGFHFMTVDMDRNELFSDNPLMLLDGVPVFDADEIIALDPLKVQKIETVKHRFHYGMLDCKGIVSYTTYNGDLDGYNLNEGALIIDYKGIQVKKEYIHPQYHSAADRNNRTPDFRNALYWAPEVKLTKGDKNIIEFYTSDDSNVYEIVVNGITKNGKPYSDHSYLEVLPASNN